MNELLVFDQVDVCYDGKQVLQNISFLLSKGEILGIAGESGSGKSTVLKAVLGILGKGGTVTNGKILFKGENLTELNETKLRKIRGKDIGMIFQNTGTSFSPLRTIGDQIYESMSSHIKITRKEAMKQTVEMFESLGLQNGTEILKSHSFELSGGMNQRVGIATAMMLHPSLLLADEPTSALDVVTQRQVCEEILRLRRLYGTSVILVTHNIGIISALADSILVMNKGKLVEYGNSEQVLWTPHAEYTKVLMNAVPHLKGINKRNQAERAVG